MTAVEITVRAFLVRPLQALSQEFDVNVALNSKDSNFLRSLGIEGETFYAPIERKIDLLRDYRALRTLMRTMRDHKFDAVHSVTPKAGLLAMAAARIAGVKNRTHTFTGQVWATRHGFARVGLKEIDRLIHRLSTCSLVDSHSQRQFLIQEGVVGPDRSRVLADGSISGVDIDRFRSDPAAREKIRNELGFGQTDLTFLYLGRLNREKGLIELARAFRGVVEKLPFARLLLVGPDEGVRHEIERELEGAMSAVRFVDFTATPEQYMAASDVFCLPSHREGFGSVLIEAGAVGIPVVASRIYGITDAAVDGETGLLHQPQDTADLQLAMMRLGTAPALRSALGANALRRATEQFSSEKLAGAWRDYYWNMFWPPPAEASNFR